METVNLHPGWKNAVSLFLSEGKAYGDLLTFKWLYDAFFIPLADDSTPFADAKKSQLAFLTQIEAFKGEMLTEHQMAIVSERSVGFRVLHPKEQTKFADDDARSNLRRVFRRQSGLLSNVNLAILTSKERQENADAMARLSHLRAKSREVYPPRAIEKSDAADE